MHESRPHPVWDASSPGWYVAAGPRSVRWPAARAGSAWAGHRRSGAGLRHRGLTLLVALVQLATGFSDGATAMLLFGIPAAGGLIAGVVLALPLPVLTATFAWTSTVRRWTAGED